MPRFLRFPALLLALLPTLLFVGAFYPGLFVGFTLVDDSTLNRVVIRWFVSNGAWSELLYNTSVQGGARYTPVFWMVKALILGAFGYNAVVYHAIHLFFCWVPLCGVPLYFAYRHKKWSLAFLPFLFFLIFSGTGWGSQLWNLYDVSTYDPLAVFFLSLTLVLLDRVTLENEPTRKYGLFLLIFLCMVGSAHSKEAYGLALLAFAVCFFLFWAFFRNRIYGLISIIAALSSLLFFWGYWYSGAMGMRSANDYTATYSLQPTLIISNSWFVIKSYLIHGTYLLPVVLTLTCLRFLSKPMREKFFVSDSLGSPMIILPLLAIVLILHGIQLPVEFLPDQPRLYYAGVIFLSYFSTLILLPVLTSEHQGLPKWLNPNVIFLFLLLPGVFVPFRVMTFNSIYTYSIGMDWNAVLQARNILKKHPDTVVSVYSPDSKSFYWGMFIHLENMNITPGIERYSAENNTILLTKNSILLTRDEQLYSRYTVVDEMMNILTPQPTGSYLWACTDYRYILSLIRGREVAPFRLEVYSTVTWR